MYTNFDVPKSHLRSSCFLAFRLQVELLRLPEAREMEADSVQLGRSRTPQKKRADSGQL
jgi:hypothetical protein